MPEDEPAEPELPDDAGIAEFWGWFELNAARLRELAKDSGEAFIREVGGVLERSGLDVICEVTGHEPSGERASLILSADGRPERVSAARAVAVAAPELADWEVVAFRQRASIAGNEIHFQGRSLGADDIYYQSFGGRFGQFGVTLAVRGLLDPKSDPLGTAAILLMDHAIGEYDAITAIQSLRLESLEDEVPAGYAPLSELPAEIDRVKEDGLDRWGVYMTSLTEEGHPASIVVKLGLATVAPQPRRSQLLRVIVPLAAPRADGLLESAEERDRLHELEDALVSELRESCDARYVGRITTCGLRDFVFYAPLRRLLETHAQRVLAAYPPYAETDLRLEEDPEWGFYFQILVPSDRESLEMHVDEELVALQEKGDDPSLERTLSWTLEFPHEAAREAFCATLDAARYEALERTTSHVDAGEDEGEREDPVYRLTLRRRSSAELSRVRGLTTELYDAVQEFSGRLYEWDFPPAC